MVMNLAETTPENDYAGEAQQQLQIADPSSPQRRRPTSTNPLLFDRNKNLVLGSRWWLNTKTARHELADRW
jgi:hypothetical protein